MRHHDIERHLYDHVTGELPDALRTAVDAHLAGCERCRAEREALARTVAAFPASPAAPAERLSDAQWAAFAAGVERRVRAEEHARRRSSLWEAVRSYVALHRARSLSFAGAGVAVLAGLFLLGRLTAPAPVVSPTEVVREADPAGTVIPASVRLERYLRKSKVLLVGLTNMKHEPGTSVDLKAERELSRSLIKEARYLRTQDIDRRSARLIDDLTKILIELANLEDEHDLPDVDIIRGGIDQENLLFKIRMAELLHDSTARTNPTF